MDRETALQRYRLALSLVSDPTAAGELMLQARDLAHLRYLANRWRTQRGLEALSEEPPLPMLDEVDEGYALHIARQAVLRRRLSVAVMVVGAVALLLLASFSLAVDARMTLAQGLNMLQPAAGVAAVVAGGLLLVRGQKDPAVFLLMGWGALLMVGGTLNTLIINRLMTGRMSNLPRWWMLTSNLFSVSYWLYIYGMATYAVWRLWPRQTAATLRSPGSAR